MYWWKTRHINLSVSADVKRAKPVRLYNHYEKSEGMEKCNFHVSKG